MKRRRKSRKRINYSIKTKSTFLHSSFSYIVILVEYILKEDFNKILNSYLINTSFSNKDHQLILRYIEDLVISPLTFITNHLQLIISYLSKENLFKIYKLIHLTFSTILNYHSIIFEKTKNSNLSLSLECSNKLNENLDCYLDPLTSQLSLEEYIENFRGI